MIGHPAVHLSSIKGVTEVRAHFLCGRSLPTGFLFSNSSTHWLGADSPFEARSFLTLLSHCPSVIWFDYGIDHVRAAPSKGKTRLMNQRHTWPSVWIWISTSIQQVLNQPGRHTQASMLLLDMVYTMKISEAGSPRLLRALGRVGGMLACGNISEIRQDTRNCNTR